ncbi:hypothetical protein SAMN05421863_100174 [Nitrosomonas communis]|uniref:Uncharacterized protein n=1 Tax=Nitrosomonas communis TaxID=44574 RepID=A0A1I4IWB1_9PROT|nr:hypothetical protein SAMN05421863_100174 [Nitrosomonas communis]
MGWSVYFRGGSPFARIGWRGIVSKFYKGAIETPLGRYHLCEPL